MTVLDSCSFILQAQAGYYDVSPEILAMQLGKAGSGYTKNSQLRLFPTAIR